MPPKQLTKVALSAGEECTISGSCTVHITLEAGVLDIAGIPLEATRAYSFQLSLDGRSLTLTTLEGGSCHIGSEVPVDVVTSATSMASLLQLVTRTILPLSETKTLVIGNERVGKTLIAHSICQLLVRRGGDNEEGVPAPVFLMDLNSESNALSGPGCVSILPVRDGFLCHGATLNPNNLPLSFFTGTSQRPTSNGVALFLHYCEQLNDLSTVFIREVAGNSNHHHVVIDAPSPLPDLKEATYYRRLIGMLHPSHVVVVVNTDRDVPSGDSSWSTFLQEDVQRTLPECEVVVIDSYVPPCKQSSKSLLALEYFVGTPSTPLGCAKVVIASKLLHFSELVTESHGVAARICQPNASWKGLVCAVSHAEILDEVPLAPIAGLVAISHVDEETGEVVLLIPADVDVLMRRFIVVSAEEERETLRLTDVQMASIEESVSL